MNLLSGQTKTVLLYPSYFNRKIKTMGFYCQKDIESGTQCKNQCSHCKEYYAPIEKNDLFLVFGHDSNGKGVILSVMAESSSQAIQNALKMRQTTKPALSTKPKYYIGIDTGTNTGIAIWNTEIRAFESVETVKIHRALDIVKQFIYIESADNVFVIVEDARKRKFDPGLTEAKKQGAGSIKRDAVIWEDFLTDLGANFRMVAPNGKLNKLAENVKLWETNCKWTKRTSKHARDAAMLVLNS